MTRPVWHAVGGIALAVVGERPSQLPCRSHAVAVNSQRSCHITTVQHFGCSRRVPPPMSHAHHRSTTRRCLDQPARAATCRSVLPPALSPDTMQQLNDEKQVRTHSSSRIIQRTSYQVPYLLLNLDNRRRLVQPFSCLEIEVGAAIFLLEN